MLFNLDMNFFRREQLACENKSKEMESMRMKQSDSPKFSPEY